MSSGGSTGSSVTVEGGSMTGTLLIGYRDTGRCYLETV